MAYFIDADDDDVEEPSHHQQPGKLIWSSTAAALNQSHMRPTPPPSPPPRAGTNHDAPVAPTQAVQAATTAANAPPATTSAAASASPKTEEVLNWNTMTEALGCYPIAATIASFLDQNALDSLARTCRQVRASLLPNRKPLLASTLRCCNEDLPVNAEETLRYRARAGNWYYMEDQARTTHDTKAGQCARDMVAGCRRCGTVVCRNCAMKPPAPIVLRDRHRRLCDGCVKAPLASVVKPRLPPGTTLEAETMQQAICCCETEGVWLCQPCGRSIRTADQDYKALWKWRTQYGELLGGLGTGIAEGDRGVICGRDQDCCCAKEREQETDCDAEDARDAERTPSGGGSRASSINGSINGSVNGSFGSLASVASSPPGNAASSSPWALPIAPATQSAATVGSPLYSPEMAAVVTNRRTPSPAVGPGYARQEIEGIGGVVKRVRVKMVRIGACVHDWDDELARGTILEREITGRTRSWCGWCYRVIPGKKDVETGGLGHTGHTGHR